MKEFLRFIVLAILTTPPNFKWQQFLERSFPAYNAEFNTPLPLTQRDAKKRDEDNEIEPAPKRKLNIKNTLTKWFIDCMTVGALVNTAVWIFLVSLLKGLPKEKIVINVRTVSYSNNVFLPEFSHANAHVSGMLAVQKY